MDEAGFRTWLEARGLQANAMNTRLGAVRRIERALPKLGVPHDDLDAAFATDGLASAIAAVKALRTDARAGGERYRDLLPQSEKPLGRLSNFAAWLSQYRQFRAGETASTLEADRIRRHALDDYIMPAREEGAPLVSIGIRAVNEALGLNQGWPNIQQSLTGPKFLEMAEVEPPIRKGPRQSTTTVLTYYLDEVPLTAVAVRAALAAVFGEAIRDTDKVFAVQAPDGRQIALQVEGKGAPLIWIEAEEAPPADLTLKRVYEPGESRHSNLPPRLAQGRRAALCEVSRWSALSRLVDHHEIRSPSANPSLSPARTDAAMPDTPAPTNLILYGPPGTGKTYATAAEAVRLCAPGVDLNDRDAVMAEFRRLEAEERIEFVTFHQSYSYEDFVEGLRPPVSNGDEAEEGASSGLRLEVSHGIFHRIASRAGASRGTGGEPFQMAGRQVFKMSIGEAANPDDAYLFEEALAEGHLLLGFGEIDWSDDRFADRQAILDEWHRIESEGEEPATAQSARVKCHDAFRNSLKIGDLVIVSKGNGSFRAIGEVTGPYEFAPREGGGYGHRRRVNWLWHDRDGAPVEDILTKRFSMLSIYRLAPSDLKLPNLQRYLTSAQVVAGPPEQFVLIIDEINRANISKVFGELITVLEPDKRTTPDGGGLKVRLPYSKEPFGVPANLHVIGTMNTADRSIALLDTALRRRFEFRELMPDPDLPALKTAGEACGVDLGRVLRTLNDRIEYLFDREHQIGHAYFIGCRSREALDAVMRHKVIPLLAEYFYEDWSRVALVLGDAEGPGRFLQRTELKPPAGLDTDASGPRYRWTVRASFAPDAYDALR